MKMVLGRGRKAKPKAPVDISIIDLNLLDWFLFCFLRNPPNPLLEEPLCLHCFKSIQIDPLSDLKCDKAYHRCWRCMYYKKSCDWVNNRLFTCRLPDEYRCRRPSLLWLTRSLYTACATVWRLCRCIKCFVVFLPMTGLR